MSDLAPDEKVCPFCAETIKKAAVRCRYCQSDLPTDEPAVVDDAAPPPPPPPVDEPDEAPPAPEAASRPPLLASLRLMIGLLVLCLVLAGAAAYSFYRKQNPSQGSGPIASTGAREDGLTQAASLTQKILSYNWQTLDGDIKSAEALMAPSFRNDYDKTMAGVRAQTVKNQVKLTAQAVASSVVSASSTKVVALVFVNQITTAKGTTNQRVDQNRVLVTLTRDGGEWRVSNMKAF